MRMTGTVTKVLLNKGFAFVRDMQGMSRFVSVRDVVPVSAFDTMHEGQKVTFEPAGDLNTAADAKNNGLRAVKVQVE